MCTAEKFVQIALSEVGVTEEKYNKVKYNKWYYGREVSAYNDESGTYAWCCVFISWCAHMAGISEDIIPKFALCTVGKAFFKKNGQDFTDAGEAKKGDIVFINWDGKSSPQHVGIVVDKDDTTVTTVEGNRSNAVRLEKYSLDDKRLIGFGRPDFKEAEIESAPQVNENDNAEIEERRNMIKKIIEYVISIFEIIFGKSFRE